VVLMDLGLAQLADDAQGKLTRTRQFVGTLRYASPEQVLAVGGLDRRTDVYSLGATLWEMLTLQPLYGVTDQTPSPELMQRIQSQEPDAVRKHNAGVPRDLEAIVLKCLEKDPKRRYATARELADDLRRFLTQEPVEARPIGPIQRAFRRARRRPAGSLAVVLFAVAVPALLGFGYWYWDTHSRLKVEYFAQYSYRNDAPMGIGRVSADDLRHRSRTWKFYLRGNRVEKMELVNGSGSCPTSGPLLGAAIARSTRANASNST
jgi:serine/threonine protein kinase